MLGMSWIKCPVTGKLRARWIRTPAPSLPAGTLHALGENSPSQMIAADREPRGGIAGKAMAARDERRVEEAPILLTSGSLPGAGAKEETHLPNLINGRKPSLNAWRRGEP